MIVFDARLLNGPLLLLIGGFFLWLAYRLWAVDPVNRGLRIFPYVTRQGLEQVIRLRLYFLSLGLFLSTQGMASVTFWYFAGQAVNSPAVAFLGSLAAGFGVFAAVKTVVVMVRLWRGR